MYIILSYHIGACVRVYMQANYGAVEVDWAVEEVRLQVWTPHEEQVLALQHTISLAQPSSSSSSSVAPTSVPSSSPQRMCVDIHYKFR